MNLFPGIGGADVAYKDDLLTIKDGFRSGNKADTDPVYFPFNTVAFQQNILNQEITQVEAAFNVETSLAIKTNVNPAGASLGINSGLYIETELTANTPNTVGLLRGIDVFTVVSGTAETFEITGGRFQGYLDSNLSTVLFVLGGVGIGQMTNGSPGAVEGLDASVIISGGSTTEANALAAFTNQLGGTITTLRGLDMTFNKSGGTTTNHIGVEIPDVTFGATLNRAIRTGAGIVELGDAILMHEISDPAAPAVDTGFCYMRDNGAGKTQLVARFPTGAIQVIATEP